ncbi:WXG100 family type VII secretion target [Leucobacter sp. 1207-22]|uniref:WXG100 family type VII secretion target n=1 Tax=Leucobacter sp. 1207-22 TaxID=2604456 RepID=UPI0040645351
MANVTISYDELNAAAGRLDAGKTEIIGKLREMQQQIQSLVSSGFVTDSASQRFESSYAEYTASTNTVVEKLTEIRQFVLSVAQAHQEMDAQIASRIQ